MSDVFISYSRKDEPFADELEAQLRVRGKTVWRDKRGIGPGTKWREEIGIGLRSADGVVFVISPDSLASAECAKELEQAVAMEKRIVPVVRRDGNGAPVPEALGEVNYVWLREQDDFDQGVTKLIEALDMDIEWVHLHTKLETRAREWEDNGHKPAYLLRGSDLTEAETTLTTAAGKKPEPTALQLEYVAASRTGSRRFMQKLLAGVSVALVVAIGLSIYALIQKSIATDQQLRAYSRQLAADAETQLGIDPELSVLLASKAYDVKPTTQSVDVLRQALTTSKLRMAVRPADGVSQASLTPDGRTLVTVGRDDGAVKLWRYPGPALMATLPGVDAIHGQMDVNPSDGRVLVADRHSGRLLVFRGSSLQFARGTAVTAAAWGAGGREIVAGERDGSIEIWNLTGAWIGRDRHASEAIQQVRMGSGGNYLAAVTAPGSTLLYDLGHRKVHTLSYQGEDHTTKVVFSPDESRVLTYNQTLTKLWSTASHAGVGDVSNWAAGIKDAAFTTDSRQLVLAGETAPVVDASTGLGGVTHQYQGHGGFVTAVAAAPGTYAPSVATGGWEGAIRVWDASQPTTSTSEVLQADAESVGSVSWSRDGLEIISVDGDGSTARVWANPASSPSATIGNPLTTQSGALSPDGSVVVTQDQAGKFALFDARSSREKRILPGAVNDINSAVGIIGVGFADAGLLTYEFTFGGLRAWRTIDGSPIAVPAMTGQPQEVVPARGSGRILIRLAGARGTTVDMADLNAGTSDRLSTTRPNAMAISPDGSRIALATGRQVQLIQPDRREARILPAIGGTGPVAALAFSADGHRLAVGGEDFLGVFDVRSRRLVSKPIQLPRAHVVSVALSGDGTTLAAGFDDYRARVWSVAGGEQLMAARPAVVHSTDPRVTNLEVSRDGQFLLTEPKSLGVTEIWAIGTGARLYGFATDFLGWSDDAKSVLGSSGPTQLWSCEVCAAPRALRALATTRVTRFFTPGERARFLGQ